ncbi:MAG TPA: NADH-quinone oxidoreductase subunit NuoE [Chloroflexota bacterium]
MEPVKDEKVDLTLVDGILDRKKGDRGALIPILQEAQEAYGYLPKPALARIAEELGMPFSQVYGVATFYSQFYLTRRGRNVIKVCDGTACHVRGAPRSMATVEKDLEVEPGGTTDDYQFTYEVVYCLGACALGPVAVVNGDVKGRCGPERIHQLVDELKK